MIDQLDVSPATIYSHPPCCPKLREEIENWLGEHSTPGYWYSDENAFYQ